MNIELIAVFVVIAIVIAISNKKKKKKPDKKSAQEAQTQKRIVIENRSTTEKSDHGIYTGKIPVVVEKDGEKTEGVLELQKQGLRIYDASGNIMLDVTSRLTKYLGTLSIGTTDGSYTDSRLQEGEFWYATLKLNEYKNCYRIDPETSEAINFLPVITRDGNTIKWNYTESDSDFRTGLTIIYGVY